MKTKSAAQKPIKQIQPRAADTQYLGNELLWEKMPELEHRRMAAVNAFAWYNYYCDIKDAKQFVTDWMNRKGFSVTDSRALARSSDRTFPTVLGWLCRMNLVGWQLDERENRYIADGIAKLISSAPQEAQEAAAPAAPKPNIQDHLRQKMLEAGGEIEAMFDAVVAQGGRAESNQRPMNILREFNVSPQMVGEIGAHWQAVAAELADANKGRDPDLVEGYRGYSRIQLRNMVKFAEQVSADCASYVQIKKVERKPRKKKPVSPEKLTARFRYLREDPSLGLKSVPVTQLVNAQEAWLYDVKRRKLIHVVPESLVGSFSVKGSSFIGFDPTQSVRKTLRKPQEQLKALLSAGAPAARKIFKDIRSAETKFNGRGNADMLILKVR